MFDNFNDYTLGIFLNMAPHGSSKIGLSWGRPWLDHNGVAMSSEDAFNYIMDLANNKRSHTKTFRIPKRTPGEYRTIIAPDKALLYVQKRLNKTIFSNFKPTEFAHGFVRGRGIATNAQNHVGARSFGHMDIKNFFDTITRDHVINILFGTTAMCKFCNNHLAMKAGQCNPSIYKNKDEGCKYQRMCNELKWYAGLTNSQYNSLVDVISRLVTLDNTCPQGFATSPFISNIVLRKFDLIVAERLAKSGITYSRYADDMAFSHQTESSGLLAKKVLAVVPSTLGLFKLKINKRKTYFITNKSRMSICNVVVNKKVNMNRCSRNLLRAEIHHATVKRASETTKALLLQLHGKVSYLHSLNPGAAEKLRKQLAAFEAKKDVQTDLFGGSYSGNKEYAAH